MKYRLPYNIAYIFFLAVITGNLGTSHVFADSSSTVVTTVSISVCGNGVKEGDEQCDGSSFNGKACGTLGFSGGELQCSPSCEFVATACESRAKKNVGLLFSSAVGGTYTLADDSDATIELQPNFHSKDLRLQMFAYESTIVEETKPTLSGKRFINSVYDFFFVDPDGASQSALSVPAELTLTYNDADVANLDESTIRPYHWGEDDSSWQEVSGSTVDTVANTVVFQTSTFSSFTLLTSSAQAEETPVSPSVSVSGGSIGFFLDTWREASQETAQQSVQSLLSEEQEENTSYPASSGTKDISLKPKTIERNTGDEAGVPSEQTEQPFFTEKKAGFFKRAASFFKKMFFLFEHSFFRSP